MVKHRLVCMKCGRTFTSHFKIRALHKLYSHKRECKGIR